MLISQNLAPRFPIETLGPQNMGQGLRPVGDILRFQARPRPGAPDGPERGWPPRYPAPASQAQVRRAA